MPIRLPDTHQNAKDEEFIEIDQAIKRSLQRFQFKTGGFLEQILERGKYGSHQTFRDYVVTDLADQRSHSF
jgi:hypothetical protein